MNSLLLILYPISIGLFFFCIFLLLKLSEAKRQTLKPEIRYVDTTGITENPPRAFIQVGSEKTINFKLDDYSVTIPMLGITEAHDFVSIIAQCFAVIGQLTDHKKVNQDLNGTRTKEQKLRWWVEEKKTDIQINRTYKFATKKIYDLSIKHVNKKKGFKKALYKKMKDDFMWGLDVLENMNDFWNTVKRKVFFLSRGTTLRQTDGYNSIWNDYHMDANGNRLVKPRYG